MSSLSATGFDQDLAQEPWGGTGPGDWKDTGLNAPSWEGLGEPKRASGWDGFRPQEIIPRQFLLKIMLEKVFKCLRSALISS